MDTPSLDWRTKGLPLGVTSDLGALETCGWNVLAGDTSTPVAVVHESALSRNLATMRGFCTEHCVSLAPHAKTHMSPELIERQLAAGAWAMTAAVPHQVAVLLELGVRRVLVANEITDPAALTWLAGRLAADPTLEIFWYVDSTDGVRLAQAAMSTVSDNVVARLLVEVGHPEGRTGARTLETALAVAGAVQHAPQLSLVGVAGYEGTIAHDRDPETLDKVRDFLALLSEVFVALDDADLLAPDDCVVTAGGSVFFDLVTEALAPLRDRRARIVLRSGCYLTHDDGFYEQVSPAVEPQWDRDPFTAAIEVWGRVLSRPEPDLALLNFGRRDVSFDMGMPVPLWTSRDGDLRSAQQLTVTTLGDQHAWLAVPPGDPLAVGDLVGVGVSHPCTTFDKWSLLLLVDDERTVVGGLRTLF